MSVYFLAGFLIAAGILHLVKPKLYKRMMPPWVPVPQFSIFISGVFEIAFGVGLLFVQTRSWSAWGAILLFIAIFPANIYTCSHRASLAESPNCFLFCVYRFNWP